MNMNILVSSYNCSPYRGSEEKLSWSTVKEYAMRDYTTYVVTNAVYKNELEKYIRENIEDMPFLKNVIFASRATPFREFSYNPSR